MDYPLLLGQELAPRVDSTERAKGQPCGAGLLQRWGCLRLPGAFVLYMLANGGDELESDAAGAFLEGEFGQAEFGGARV